MSDPTERDNLRREQEAALLHDYLVTFSSEAGQRVLADLERRAFASRTVMTRSAPGSPVDPYETCFNEGRRVQALEIRARYERGRQLTKTEPSTTAASVLTQERTDD